MDLIKPPKPEPVWLQPFLLYCHTKTYEKGVDIMRQGDPAETFYYLIEGSVEAVIDDDDKRELLLAYINKGEFIGEMGLFVHQTSRGVIIRTRVKCCIAEIAYARIDRLLDNEMKDYAKAFLFAVGHQISQRLRQTSRKVGDLAFLDVTGRIAGTLLDLCEQPDAMTHPDGMQLRVTRQEIGRIVGCSREMVGRVLKSLEEQGLITASGKTIVVFGTR